MITCCLSTILNHLTGSMAATGEPAPPVGRAIPWFLLATSVAAFSGLGQHAILAGDFCQAALFCGVAIAELLTGLVILPTQS